MMYHRTLGYTIVKSEKEEMDLGPHWSRKVWAKEPEKESEQEDEEKPEEQPQEVKPAPQPAPAPARKKSARGYMPRANQATDNINP